jgi:hypothetical protein
LVHDTEVVYDRSVWIPSILDVVVPTIPDLMGLVNSTKRIADLAALILQGMRR